MEVHMPLLPERHDILWCSQVLRQSSKSFWMGDFTLLVQARLFQDLLSISGPALEQLDAGTSLLLPLDSPETAF